MHSARLIFHALILVAAASVGWPQVAMRTAVEPASKGPPIEIQAKLLPCAPFQEDQPCLLELANSSLSSGDNDVFDDEDDTEVPVLPVRAAVTDTVSDCYGASGWIALRSRACSETASSNSLFLTIRRLRC
jgi:hypothetical protein